MTAPSLLPHEHAALEEVVAAVRARFGERVRQIALFGSRARGDAHELSDVDVLVVVEDLTHAEGREVAYFAGDALTRHDVLISPFAVSVAHMELLRSRERLIAAEIDRDGIPL